MEIQWRSAREGRLRLAMKNVMQRKVTNSLSRPLLVVVAICVNPYCFTIEIVIEKKTLLRICAQGN